MILLSNSPEEGCTNSALLHHLVSTLWVGAGLRQEATILLDRSSLLNQRFNVLEHLRFRLALQQLRKPT